MAYYTHSKWDPLRPMFMQYANNVDMLNHHLYQGSQTFADKFRVLIAGGGTGNGVCLMGEQLRYTNAEIVYLDFSRASMDIAQQRVNIRQLGNVQFVLDKIENIPGLGLGDKLYFI